MEYRGSEAKRVHLLTAAAEEITECGYAATTLSAIAARLGMGKGAYAYHFPTKADIAVAILDRQRTVWAAVVSESAKEYPGSGILPLCAVVVRLSRLMRSDPLARAAMILITDPSARQLELDDPFPIWTESTSRFFALAAANGELTAGHDPGESAEYFLEFLIGAFLTSERLHETGASISRRHLVKALEIAGVLDPDDQVAAAMSHLSEMGPVNRASDPLPEN